MLADKQRMLHKRILLIEDDPDYQQLISTALGACADIEMKPAFNLAGGLALLDEYLPELILLDLSLPDSSGYETFLCVQEHAHGIPIIVLTGLDDDQVAIQAVEDGAADYLVKSQMRPNNIARCVQMAFGRQ